MVTIFRTINGRVVPLNVSDVRESKPITSSLRKSDSKRLFGKQHYSHFSTFTVPNVECPVCGQYVFYYEHPNGGKVYFEELGPPWTKHPCTSHERPIRLSRSEEKSIKEKKYQPNWQINNWKPFKVVSTKHKELGIGVPKGAEVRVKSGSTDGIFYITAIKMKRMRVNIHSLKGLLIQGKVEDEMIVFDIHDGERVHFIEGQVVREPEHGPDLKLTSVEVELPNSDGHNAFIKGRAQKKDIFAVLDLREEVYQDALDHIIHSSLKLTVRTKKPKAAHWIGETFELCNQGDCLCTFENKKVSQRERFLSPSQRAKSISERKQKRGGNSSIADAFAQAFQKK